MKRRFQKRSMKRKSARDWCVRTDYCPAHAQTNQSDRRDDSTVCGSAFLSSDRENERTGKR